jgi:hypothetical protein
MSGNFLVSTFLLVKDTFKNTFKKTIKEKYEEKILEKISNLDVSSKLFLYSPSSISSE